MRQHGRKSAAAIAAGLVVHGPFGERPEPPDELTEPQKEIWRRTVASENVEFFKSAAAKGLLADYCRHRQAAEAISEIINSFQPEWLKSKEGCARYESLLKMRAMEARGAASMARALRITNQARYMPNAAARMEKRAATSIMPWDE